jgi:F-type H+-transporting ATPase subunit epsilon
MAQFDLAIVAPDREVFSQPVSSIVAPGAGGYLGVLPGHEPAVIALKAGLVEYTQSASGGRHYVVISGGFIEITPNRVTVLADAAEIATEVDVARAEVQLEEARKVLRGESSAMTQDQAMTTIDYASQRLRAAKGSSN